MKDHNLSYPSIFALHILFNFKETGCTFTMFFIMQDNTKLIPRFQDKIYFPGHLKIFWTDTKALEASEAGEANSLLVHRKPDWDSGLHILLTSSAEQTYPRAPYKARYICQTWSPIPI